MLAYCATNFHGCFVSWKKCLIELVVLIIMSSMAIPIVRRLFTKYKSEFLRAGFSGVDMGKTSRPTLPEGQGVLCGIVYLSLMFFFIPVPFVNFIFERGFTSAQTGPSITSSTNEILLIKSQFIHYLAGLLSICCMIFLGFADDALNLPWKHKILFPSVASLPLLMVYVINDGATRIVVPVIFRSVCGETVDIGILYYVYMGMLAVFCTNSINIFAGINGLEAGQSIVITCSLITFNCLELNGLYGHVHLFSLYFLIPFLAVSGALYIVNRYPAQVFVGDTYCYFAGMTFAVVGILGHFSKTLLLFFIPQIMNFVYSIPQILELVPCPRHRLPRFDSEDGLLHPSTIRFHPKSLSRFGQCLLNVLSKLKLIDCKLCTPFTQDIRSDEEHLSNPLTMGDKEQSDENDAQVINTKSKYKHIKDPLEEIVEVNNLTLINAVLLLFGPMHERQATKTLLLLQVVSTCVAFVIRYPIAWLLYDLPGH